MYELAVIQHNNFSKGRKAQIIKKPTFGFPNCFTIGIKYNNMNSATTFLEEVFYLFTISKMEHQSPRNNFSFYDSNFCQWKLFSSFSQTILMEILGNVFKEIPCGKFDPPYTTNRTVYGNSFIHMMSQACEIEIRAKFIVFLFVSKPRNFEPACRIEFMTMTTLCSIELHPCNILLFSKELVSFCFCFEKVNCLDGIRAPEEVFFCSRNGLWSNNIMTLIRVKSSW